MDMEDTTMIKNIMDQEVSRASNAHHNARGDAARLNTTSHACSSVRSVAESACVCHQGITVIKQCALATTTGRLRKEDPSAPDQIFPLFSHPKYSHFILIIIVIVSATILNY